MELQAFLRAQPWCRRPESSEEDCINRGAACPPSSTLVAHCTLHFDRSMCDDPSEPVQHDPGAKRQRRSIFVGTGGFHYELDQSRQPQQQGMHSSFPQCAHTVLLDVLMRQRCTACNRVHANTTTRCMSSQPLTGHAGAVMPPSQPLAFVSMAGDKPTASFPVELELRTARLEPAAAAAALLDPATATPHRAMPAAPDLDPAATLPCTPQTQTLTMPGPLALASPLELPASGVRAEAERSLPQLVDTCGVASTGRVLSRYGNALAPTRVPNVAPFTLPASTPVRHCCA